MKRLLEPLSTAWTAVATHKLRSFLTILGVVIGVAAVIIPMSVGKGATARISSPLAQRGPVLRRRDQPCGAPCHSMHPGL